MEPTITNSTLNQIEHQTLLNAWVALTLGLSQFVALAACICAAFRKTTAALVCFIVFGTLVFLVGNELGVTIGGLIIASAIFGLIYGRVKRRSSAAAQPLRPQAAPVK